MILLNIYTHTTVVLSVQNILVAKKIWHNKNMAFCSLYSATNGCYLVVTWQKGIHGFIHHQRMNAFQNSSLLSNYSFCCILLLSITDSLSYLVFMKIVRRSLRQFLSSPLPHPLSVHLRLTNSCITTESWNLDLIGLKKN